MYPTPLHRQKPRRKRSRKPLLISLGILLIAAAYSGVALLRPLTGIKPVQASSTFNVTTESATLPWPGYGQGAFGLADGTVVATNGQQEQVSMASTTKVMTALVILDKYPLKAGESGPTITMTAQDVALYNRYVSIRGSVMPVAEGQRLTLKQLLQGLMLPSANNVADSLAIWAYGSVDKYLSAANAYAKQNGMNDTVIAGDASGYLPDSRSTTADMVRLGALAMRDPVLSEIVGQKSAVIPGTGTVTNYNSLLGSGNVVGVKTGNNDENTGVFIGASRVTVGGKPVTVISALSGAPNLSRVLRDSAVLLAAASANFARTTVVKKGAVLGTYEQANGELLQAVAADDISAVVLRGDDVKATVNIRPITYTAKAGQDVGKASVAATGFSATASSPIILQETPYKPGITYRLLHPLGS